MVFTLILVLPLLALWSWVKSLSSPSLMFTCDSFSQNGTINIFPPYTQVISPLRGGIYSYIIWIWTVLLFLSQIEMVKLIMYNFQSRSLEVLQLLSGTLNMLSLGGACHHVKHDHHTIRKPNLVMWRHQVKREIPNQPPDTKSNHHPAQAGNTRVKESPNDSRHRCHLNATLWDISKKEQLIWIQSTYKNRRDNNKLLFEATKNWTAYVSIRNNKQQNTETNVF